MVHDLFTKNKRLRNKRSKNKRLRVLRIGVFDNI